MDDFFWLIFFFIFIVGPILQKMKKGGAGQQPPQRRPLPGQRPPQRTLPEQPGLPTEEPARASADSGDDSATELLPGDLWEMLTGQRPAHGEPMRTGPRRQAPEPSPEPEWEEAAVTRPVPETRKGRELGDRRIEAEQLKLRRQLEVAESRTVRRESRKAVSLETTPLPEPKRHAEFHRKLEQELAPVPEVTGIAKAAFRMDRMGRSDLQRAILLKEILGEPKGLE